MYASIYATYIHTYIHTYTHAHVWIHVCNGATVCLLFRCGVGVDAWMCWDESSNTHVCDIGWQVAGFVCFVYVKVYRCISTYAYLTIAPCFIHTYMHAHVWIHICNRATVCLLLFRCGCVHVLGWIIQHTRMRASSYRVLVVQMRRGLEGNEELRSVGVRAAVSHR
jgi:hypothetical protein